MRPEQEDPAHRPLRALALVILFGLLLQVPSLFLGFYADDYVHRLALGEQRELMPMRPWSLYDFGTRAEWARFEAAEGAFPWWTSPDWKVRFFRPLTSLTLWLDHAVWGERASGSHLTSLVLYALLLALVHRTFRLLGLARRTALLGLLLFELSDASVIPVGWIANRNSLLEALFATGALVMLFRAPGVPRAGSILGALLCGIGASLSKESGVFVFPLVALLLIARALRAESGRARALAGAASACALFFGWIGALALAGFGTRSLFYVTPWEEPARFAGNVLVLATGGLLSLAGPFPLDAVTVAPELRVPIVVAGLLAGVPLALWIARSIAGRAGALALASWTFLFLLPQGGVAPSDRLLFGSSIGAAGLLALFFEAQRERKLAGESSRLALGLVRLLFLAATAGSGVSLVVQELGLVGLADHLRTKALATDIGPHTHGEYEVIVLQTESQMQAFTLGETWRGEGGDPRVRFWLAQAGSRPLRWTRVNSNAFELESLGEPFLTGLFERVYLAHEPDLTPGTTWHTKLFTVETIAAVQAVAESDASAASEAGLYKLRFTLDRPLDAPSIRFVRPVEGVLTRIDPPEVSEPVVLEKPVPSLAFGP
jgi:hypothetical protein